jgi:3-oxoacyl-(acyl-carrier-protein) synthase
LICQKGIDDLAQHYLSKNGITVTQKPWGSLQTGQIMSSSRACSTGMRTLSNPVFPMMISDMAGAQISINVGAKGANICSTSACSSGSDAIGNAYEILKRGDALAIVAGGAEAVITPIGVAGFNAARALSTRNDNPQTVFPSV